MQEDIKILENAIKKIENDKDIGFFVTEEDFKFYNAVKHLLKAYKEKEADLYSANSIISEQIDIINNSVSKDKIKEKMSSLDKKITYIESQYSNGGQNCDSNYLSALYQKQVLLELLEGDE